MDKGEAVDILETIQAAYPKFEMEEKTLRLWVKLLEKKDYQLSMNKLEQHIFKSVFPPTIADIAAEANQPNEFLEKTKQWEADVIAERNRK